MPYRHFHDWSFHTHHRRPKGGNHYRAIRRRQRPWRIGAFVALVLTAVAGAVWFGAWLNSQGLISNEWTATELPPSFTTPAAAVIHTATPEVAATQTPVHIAAPVDTPTVPVIQPDSTTTPEATYTSTSTPPPTFTPIPTRTATSRQTRTPSPTRTPRPTTTTPPTATQIPGRAELYKPIYPPNHMATVQWAWQEHPGFKEVEFDFTIHNDILTNSSILGRDYGIYLILNNSSVSGTGYYFGIQVDHTKRCIFSRWDTRDLNNVRVPENGYTESAGYEGDFISVRKDYSWTAGNYRARIAADGDDTEGRWFGLWITNKDTSNITWCGSLRFPYKNSKALLDNYSVSVAEIFGKPSQIKPIEIPKWHVTMQKPVADGSKKPVDAYLNYSNYDGSGSAPNSNLIYDRVDSAMHIYVGGATERTTEEGWISLSK